MTITEPHVQSQIEGLATLLVLDDETRKLGSMREFGFFATNETHRLIPYHTAWLWQKNLSGNPELLNQSGTATLDHSAPLNQWVLDKIRQFSHSEHVLELYQMRQEDLSSVHVLSDTLPPNMLWCPLLDHQDRLSGGIVFFREQEFSAQEIKMLRWLLASYQYTWLVLYGKRKLTFLKKLQEKRVVTGVAVTTTLVLCLPVRLSVLGSATVIPLDPILVNAPMQGIIKSFAVKPGDRVVTGQLLFSLDKTDLEADRNVNQKELQLTQSKLRTSSSQAFIETVPDQPGSSTAEIPVLKAQLDIDRAHVTYTENMLARADVKSPISGIVVFDSRDDWIGQPVQTGERILFVADPDRVQLKIMLPVANAIRLEKEAVGAFYPSGQLHAVSIRIKTIGYSARLTPARILAYPMEAEFTEGGTLPQLGTEGTAKLYGHRVPLVYYLFRRPIEAFRQSFGI